MIAPRAVIEAEFDRLAAFEDEVGLDDSVHAYPWLLARLPARLGRVAEVGCGTGTFTTLLAHRAGHVLAIDVSPRMLERARARCAGQPSVELRHGDAHDWAPAARSLDAVISIGTAHHLDLDALLPRWTAALAPGGILLILDMLDERGFGGKARRLAGRLYSRWRRFRLTGRQRPDPAVIAAWAAHDRFGGHATWEDARRRAASLRPRARVRRHLPGRYSLEWRARADSGAGQSAESRTPADSSTEHSPESRAQADPRGERVRDAG